MQFKDRNATPNTNKQKRNINLSYRWRPELTWFRSLLTYWGWGFYFSTILQLFLNISS